MLPIPNYKLPKIKQKELLRQFKEAKKNADVEKSVERATIDMLETYLLKHPMYQDVSTTYPFNTDGIIQTGGDLFGDSLTILVETKRDKHFAINRKDILEVCAQVISYLKQIKTQDPHKYPNVIVVADNNEIFLLPSILLDAYTEKDYDWSLPASEMKKDTNLINDLAEDKNIRPFVHDINENFDISDFCTQLISLAQETGPVKIKIGKASLSDAFESFRKLVFGTNDPNVIQSENRRQIEIFSRTLLGDEDVYAHPKKKNVLLVDGEELENVDTEGYELFVTRYDANHYSFDEYKKITQMSDTLIAEANRRFRGDYYTPKVWVDEAHRMISEQLGEGWKEEYVVWDPAAGTKNLTRDYKFSNLFSSTLYEGELMATSKFNKDNVSFQYDFLNDDMCLHDGSVTLEDLKTMSDEQIETTLKMPVELVKKLLNKEKIVFFTNPPYGQASDAKGGNTKQGIGMTSVRDFMDKMNMAKRELYTQFIYRVQLLADFFEYNSENSLSFFFFFNKGFITSPSFSTFNKKLTHQFHFNKGFMINAGEFLGTAERWGIVFSHWSLNGEKDQRNFPFEVKKSKGGEIHDICTWNGQMITDSKSTINAWVSEIPTGKPLKEGTFARTTDGFNAPEKSTPTGKYKENAIGFLVLGSANVQRSQKYVALNSFCVYSAHEGFSVTHDNFIRASVTFSIRRAVWEGIYQKDKLWIQDKDMFVKPSEGLLTSGFITDCVIYSLFNSQSNQTSLRDFQYNGKTYRLENEFFPFSRDFITTLALEHNNLDIQADLQGDDERFVYKWIEEHKQHLSPEANELLSLAEQLFIETFPYRDEYAKIQPRFQTNSWDAGYAQIARLAFGNDRINDEFLGLKEQFYSARTRLGEKISQAAIDDGAI